jgi:hypothetical protein
MTIIAIIAAAFVMLVGGGVGLWAGRKHRQERHEVENFFAHDPPEQAWWEERR